MKAFLLAIAMLVSAVTVVKAEPEYLLYDKFIAELEAGTVKGVSLDQFSQIEGTYVVDGVEKPFRSYGATGTANDVLLIRLAKQKGVAVTIQEKEDKGMFWGASAGFLMLGIPILTLVMLFVMNAKINRLVRRTGMSDARE